MSFLTANSSSTALPDKSKWESQLDVSYQISPLSRIIIRTSKYRNRLVDYAIIHQILVDGRWLESCRVDCAHGTIHIHLFDMAGNELSKEDIVKINQQSDIYDSYTEQYNRVFETCLERERQWGNARK